MGFLSSLSPAAGAKAQGGAREWDVVVFGATGFTGRHVLRELLRVAPPALRLAAAGRNAAKVAGVVEAEAGAGSAAPRACGVLEADVGDAGQLAAVAARARLLVSCVGPFRKFGEAVVAACVEAGTHYLDICGEPEFIERMDLLYGGPDGPASRKGCYVVSGVGFDSVPCDLGVLHNQQVMREVGLTPSSVESFLTMEAGKAGAAAHYTTWEALVLGFANAGNLRGIRKQLVKRVPLAKPAGPKPERLKGARYDNRVHAWALPFLGSDASIVRRTQNALAADAEYVKRHGFAPVHHAAKFTVAGRSSVLLFGFFGAVLQALVPYAWGRRLLLQFPRFFTYGVFSHEGPTPEQIDGAGFSMTFFGKGFTSEEAVRRGRPDKQVVTKIRGPEPGYVACSIFMAHAAMVVLEEPRKLCAPGVRTTGELLFRTSYLDRLRQGGISIATILK